MKYKIVGDSCCDLKKSQLEKEYFASVPLKLYVDGKEYIDDENLNQKEFLEILDSAKEGPKSACPSPEDFMKEFKGVDNVFVVTLSSKLSGSFNSAVIAGQMYCEENPNARVHVFDSQSAAAAQYLICCLLEECMQKNMEFDDIVAKVEEYISKLNTIFVLDNLDVMRKNGRMTKVKSVVAGVLNIKPVLYGVEGEIQQLDQARGMNKALNKLLWHIENSNVDTSRKVVITQCDSMERCLNVKKILKEKFGFNDIEIVNAGGLSSMYENRGGVVVAL